MHDGRSRIVGSLRMREPEALAGPWSIEIGQQHCSIRLETKRVEAANGWALVDSSGCLAAALPGAVVWRPIPEGIEFAAADRRSVIVFTATGDAPVGEGTLPDGRAATLRPA